MSMYRICAVLVAFGAALLAQESETDSLVRASVRFRTAVSSGNEIESFGKTTRAQLNELEMLVRDWLEARLPSNSASLEARFNLLQAQLTAELWRAGVLEQPSRARNGNLTELGISRPTTDPNLILVRVGVFVPCGSDDFLLMYRFATNARVRILEAHGESKWGNSLQETKFSEPDTYGRRILYASWYGVQCASVWNGLDYRLFRIGPESDRALQLLSESHDFTIDDDLNVRVDADGLLLEVTAGAMEGGFRRTHVLHYAIGAEGVQRIDPVALQPQDFVHEWLLRPWSEMESRSSTSVAKWHKFLHADRVSGEYEFVQPCKERQGMTQVSVGIYHIGDQEVPEPMVVYFLVQDQGGYHFKLVEASFDRQPGCPGQSHATYDNAPSLFKK